MAIPLESDLDAQSTARLLSLPAPASDGEPVRKVDLDNAVESLKSKDNVRVGTGSNIDLSSPGATIDGETMASDDRVLVRSQTDASENGIYVYNGSSTAMTRTVDANTAAELTNAVVSVREGSDEGVTYRQTATVTTLDTDDLTWSTFGSGIPSASETTEGKVELASQAEVDGNTGGDRVVTSDTLNAWSGRYQAGGTAIGDGSATQYDVTHNYATRDVAVIVTQAASPYEAVMVEWKAQTTTAVRLNFASAPSSGEFRVLIQKIG